jgi:hypothetical protein
MITKANQIIKLMKVISLFTFIVIGTARIHAQDKDFDMTLKIVDASSATVADGSLSIKVDKEDLYTFMLFNKEPWEGGKELAHNESTGSEYSFTALQVGDYYVCVKSKGDVTRCQKFTIKSNR